MSFLLHPAIALMQRLRLLPKFVLVCLAFLLPLMSVSALLTAELNRSIAATRAEQSGAEAIGQLVQPGPDVLGCVRLSDALIPGDQRSTGHHPCDTSQPDPLPDALHTQILPKLRS